TAGDASQPDASDDGQPTMSDDGGGTGNTTPDDPTTDNSTSDDVTNDDSVAADGAAGDDSAADDMIASDDPATDDTAANDSGLASERLTAVPVGDSEAALGYWEYLPPNYGDEPLPLLIFTHGAAWQGEGSLDSLQELLEVGPPNLISTDAWPDERPFIVLSPQNPRSGCFDASDIDAFYRYAVERYDVDMTRIYHTGQ